MSTVLQAKERTELRRSELRKIRKSGNVPAVIYGRRVDSKPVYVSSAELTKTIKQVGRNGIISLDVNGSKQDVILTDYQENHFTKEMLHADFLAVDKSSKINVMVRVVLVGEAAGVKDGGVMQQPLHELSITSTPSEIPQQIEVDVSNLQVGETVTVGDILYGEFTINNEPDEVIASILPPKQEEEIDAGEQQEPGHPDNEEDRETTPVGE